MRSTAVWRRAVRGVRSGHRHQADDRLSASAGIRHAGLWPPWLYGVPANVSRGNFYGFKDSDYLRSNVDVGTIRVEHDLNDNLTLRTQFRYGNYQRSVRITETQIVYTGITPLTQLSSIGVSRAMIAVSSTETFLQDQTDMVARFDTGGLQHNLVTGFEVGHRNVLP